jgi:hypothetical protein
VDGDDAHLTTLDHAKPKECRKSCPCGVSWVKTAAKWYREDDTIRNQSWRRRGVAISRCSATAAKMLGNNMVLVTCRLGPYSLPVVERVAPVASLSSSTVVDTADCAIWSVNEGVGGGGGTRGGCAGIEEATVDLACCHSGER